MMLRHYATRCYYERRVSIDSVTLRLILRYYVVDGLRVAQPRALCLCAARPRRYGGLISPASDMRVKMRRVYAARHITMLRRLLLRHAADAAYGAAIYFRRRADAATALLPPYAMLISLAARPLLAMPMLPAAPLAAIRAYALMLPQAPCLRCQRC